MDVPMDGVDFQPFWQDPRVSPLWPQAGCELPDEAPLSMPVQSFLDTPLSGHRPATSPANINLRRTVLIGTTVVATLIAIWPIGRVLMLDQLGPLDVAILAVFLCLFGWITFWFVTATAGLVTMLQRKACPLGIDPAAPQPRLSGRTAIVAPIFNEETQQVFARLQAICESVETTGQGSHFDLFVLSDSTNLEIQAAERHAFDLLRQRVGGETGVYYRRRHENIDRKAGNVAEWVRRFGGAYEFMLVLDADSLMTGDTLVRLAGAMEANPGVGLLQTLPMIVNRSSLFGRAIQFASRLYGPVLAHGLAWWSGSEGNYWGHNAIIRTRAFAAAAGLPQLEGAKPFGGAIMSHDFVEAALIRRAGYAVHMAPALGGSFEECPPNLDALMQRDRRWCQGNLQHLRVLNASGFHWVSRMHLFNGVLAYLTAPLWFAMLAMSVLLPLRPNLGGGLVDAIEAGPLTLDRDQAAMGWLFFISMSFLIAPKLYGYFIAMADPVERKAFGGRWRALGGVGIEILMSVLIAPVMMLSQTRLVFDLLRGRDSGWSVQQRSEGGVEVTDAIRCHTWHTVVGVYMSILAWHASPMVLLWLSPILLGLLFSIPIGAAIARCDLGLAAKARGWLVAPEETRPPEILTRANRLVGAYPPPTRTTVMAGPSAAGQVPGVPARI
jgi:membrane glycosyltransferase